MMDLSKTQINLIGALAVGAIVLAGSLLVVVPLFITADHAHAQAEAAASSDTVIRAELAEIARLDERVTDMRSDLDRLRSQIPSQDELRDASILASGAARSAGARIVAITFADRQVFALPGGVGLGDDAAVPAPQATADANTPHQQLPVTFEVEVTSTAQAAAFLGGLRSGPRMLQVVEAQASPTNDPKLFTLTVDALLFVARG